MPTSQRKRNALEAMYDGPPGNAFHNLQLRWSIRPSPPPLRPPPPLPLRLFGCLVQQMAERTHPLPPRHQPLPSLGPPPTHTPNEQQLALPVTTPRRHKVRTSQGKVLPSFRPPSLPPSPSLLAFPLVFLPPGFPARSCHSLSAVVPLSAPVYGRQQ